MTTWEAGREGERIAAAYERARLGVGQEHRAVRLVSHIPNLGYDVESRDHVGDGSEPRYIEVKVTSRPGEFIISENEFRALKGLKEHAYLYLVSLAEGTVVRTIKNPFGGKHDFRLITNTYKAFF